MSDIDPALLKAIKTTKPVKAKVFLAGGDDKTYLTPGGHKRWLMLAQMIEGVPWQRVELCDKKGEILVDLERNTADLDIPLAGAEPSMPAMQVPKLEGQPDWLQASVQMMGMFMPMHSALLNQHLRGQQLVLEEHRKWTDVLLSNVLGVLNTVTSRVDAFERSWGKMLQFSFDTTRQAAKVNAAEEGESGQAFNQFMQAWQMVQQPGALQPAQPTPTNGQTAPATPAPIATRKVVPNGAPTT